MFKNAFYETKRSKIYLWEQVNGVDSYRIVDWSPYVFVPHEQGNIKTLDGVSVIKREFDSFHDYNDFQKSQRDIYENEMPREIQYLAEEYHTVPDADIQVPNLKIYSLDIEVGLGGNERGFPKPSTAQHTVTLINVRCFGGKNVSWGIKNYTGEKLKDNTFVYCKSEIDLLQQFFAWWKQNAPDVVTGWNIVANSKMNARGGFDLPYLVNRSKVLFGEKTDLYKSLSPIGIVRTWEDSETQAMNINIAGVTVMDYLALYKWYTAKNADNHKLDTICKLELNVGKLDYSEYGSLNDLFHKNWNMYVEYNMIDNERIEQLENELGYIRLAQNLTLLCRCKMGEYMSATSLVEGLMLTHYRRKDLCAPYLAGGHQEWFPAAYVKPPKKGRYEWVVDLDIASSYPTAIITLNMSPETYYGRVMSYMKDGKWVEMITDTRNEDEIEDVVRNEIPITDFVRARQFPTFKMRRDTGITLVDGAKLESFNRALKKGLVCVAPCGSMFMTNKRGHFSTVEHEVYNKRVEVKNIMKKVKQEAQKTQDPVKKTELTTRAANLFALQWALKIVLNSAYGVTGVPYSRYFNINISEAITSCGRRAVVTGEKYVNRLLNNPHLRPEMVDFMTKVGCDLEKPREFYDLIAYCDTDSLFIRCFDFLNHYDMDRTLWDSLSDDDKIKKILELSAIIEAYVNDCSFQETQVEEYNSQVPREEFSIAFKQEIVCKSALFVMKKKYGYHVVNKEHVPCDQIDVTGMEIIRSETPAIFRGALKELLAVILKGGDKIEIMEVYNRHKKAARDVSTEEISENKGIKDINKWLVEGQPIKGTPYHVKAVVAYHHLLEQLGLQDTYPEIEEDSKNKLVCVKNNPWGIKRVMYDIWPLEFEKAGIFADYTEMIDKYFTRKLMMLLEPMDMAHIVEENQNFNLFFA